MKKEINYNLILGIILTGFIFLLILTGIFITPYDADEMIAADRLQPPSDTHVCGTDNMGRDILSRIMTGGRNSIIIVLGTVALGALIGIIVGAVSGYFGGLADELLMRLNDTLASFPGIMIALVAAAVLGQGMLNMIIALGIIFAPSFARIIRSEFIRCRELEYVQSAKVMGAGSLRIMFVHIFPNTITSLVSAVTIGLANALLAEASLSYLGLGASPDQPSWGRMIQESQAFMFNAPWYCIFPGLAIVISVLGFYFLGDGIKKLGGYGNE